MGIFGNIPDIYHSQLLNALKEYSEGTDKTYDDYINKVLPTIDEAIKELEMDEKLNPGPWVKHSMNVGVVARNIAEKVPGLDPEKAYIVGLMYDIGRRVGVVDITTHIHEGYKYCMERCWDEVAGICMTHSYLLMQ